MAYRKQQRFHGTNILQFTGFHPHVVKTFAYFSAVLQDSRNVLVQMISRENSCVLLQTHKGVFCRTLLFYGKILAK